MMRLGRLSIPVISGSLSLMWCLAAAAQESAPPLPDPGPHASAVPPGAASSREVQLEEEVRQLKEMVRQLSARVEDLSVRTSAGAMAPTQAPRPTSSGLAGPGGFRSDRGPSDSGLRVPPSDGSRVPS